MGKPEEDYATFVQHMPPLDSDESVVVLKGHLLIERLLREYCKEHVFLGKSPRSQQHFHFIYWVTRAARYKAAAPWIWEATDLLNVIRNDLAHQLEPQRHAANVENFVRVVREGYGGVNVAKFAGMSRSMAIGVSIFFLHDALSEALDQRSIFEKMAPSAPNASAASIDQ